MEIGPAFTEALRPVAPAVTGLTAVMVGVAGAATTVTALLAAELAVPAELTSAQVSLSVPTAPGVKVMAPVP